MMNSGHGFGKIILFGEHFVVHNAPAIVAALNVKTTAKIIKIGGSKSVLYDRRPKTPSFVSTKKQKYYRLLSEILMHMGIDKHVEVELGGDLLVTSGGVGASAATAASIARALNTTFELHYDDENINDTAWVGEKAVHGNPSGIDNTAAVFGGMFLFKKNKDTAFFVRKKINISAQLDIVIADSKKVSDTQEVLCHVALFKNKKTAQWDKLCNAYEQLVSPAQEALKNNDMKMLGALMNNNHDLLKKLDISCPELDDLVTLARQAGALGAKLSGTGRGGVIVALTPGRHLQMRVAQILRENGYMAIETSLG